jgi:hypothetical protein
VEVAALAALIHVADFGGRRVACTVQLSALKVWLAQRGDAESLAAKLRGEAKGKMSLSFVDDLQTRVERLEEEVLKTEAAGMDSGGDQVALSHLKALVEHLRASEKSPIEPRGAGGSEQQS